jgi:ribosomal protein S18 acetylase RimI-like enzyme
MNRKSFQYSLNIHGEARAIKCSNVAQLKRPEKPQVLAAIKQAEKKAFPATEMMDFDLELAKHNTQLISLSFLDHNPSEILGYLLYSRIGRQASLHKICTLPAYRRQGLGRLLIGAVQKALSQSGCLNIQLWVDESREPARGLYRSSGFAEKQLVEDYYGPGRSGIKLICDLDHRP